MICLVTYDISNDEIRNKIAELLKEYGYRVQLSCFEIECTKTELNRILKTIESMIEEGDSVYFYPITKNAISNIVEIGVKRSRTDAI